MSQEADRKIYLRNRILSTLQRTPESLSGASVQVVRQFKAAYSKLQKQMQKHSHSVNELESINQQVEGLYK